MKDCWTLFRVSALALVVAGGLGLGTRPAQSKPDPASPQGLCNQTACRAECGVFGGHLGPGGPGEPLQCRCCG
jgi:hypothetical protein